MAKKQRRERTEVEYKLYSCKLLRQYKSCIVLRQPTVPRVSDVVRSVHNKQLLVTNVQQKLIHTRQNQSQSISHIVTKLDVWTDTHLMAHCL